MSRGDREDTSRQEQALRDARTELAEALSHLSSVASTEAKIAARKNGAPDLDDVRSAMNRVDRAETAVDLATYDLHTARGGDG